MYVISLASDEFFRLIFNNKLDNAKNDEIKGKLCKISAPDSKVEVWVVPTNEELLIARDTLALISK